MARTPGVPKNPRSRRPVERAATHLVRSTSWSGLAPGDTVDVDGMAGRAGRWAWTFVAHVRNEHNGEEWIEVVGGRGTDKAVRSFAPDRIFPAGGLKGARPSLAEAPQLPF